MIQALVGCFVTLTCRMDPPYSEGDAEGINVVDTEFGRIGVVICADTFSDEYANHIASLKPDLMLVPYGWAETVDKWPAHETGPRGTGCQPCKTLEVSSGWNRSGRRNDAWSMDRSHVWWRQCRCRRLRKDTRHLRDRDTDVGVIDLPLRYSKQ
jgi:hypothetical protein